MGTCSGKEAVKPAGGEGTKEASKPSEGRSNLMLVGSYGGKEADAGACVIDNRSVYGRRIVCGRWSQVGSSSAVVEQ